MRKNILILSANPKTTEILRLEREVKEIIDALNRSRYRDSYDIKQRGAVTYADLVYALLDIEPQIVHFAGHGGGVNGIILEDENGQPAYMSGEVLADLFEKFIWVECVILNACYTTIQAEEIAKYVN